MDVDSASSSACPQQQQQQQEETPSPSQQDTATFGTQANALILKNLTFQKRSYKTNCCLILFPALLIAILVTLQAVVNTYLDGPKFKCGCIIMEVNSSTGNHMERKCGLEYSSIDQAHYCPIQHPLEWPSFLQVPANQYRATQSNSEFLDLPHPSCRIHNNCSVALLYTGQNKSISEDIMNSIFSPLPSSTSNDIFDTISKLVPGTDSWPSFTYQIEPAISGNNKLFIFNTDCSNLEFDNSSFLEGDTEFEVKCDIVECFWHNNKTTINKELYDGFMQGKSKTSINEISTAYDFGGTNLTKLDVTIWYNHTFKNETDSGMYYGLVRVSRSMNMVAKAFLRLLNGSNSELPLLFVKDMPKSESAYRFDLASELSPLFYMLIIQLLLLVILQLSVYEKEHNIRIMMKMHGLGDGPYLTVSYLYFLLISILYLLCLVVIGSAAGLYIFTLNDYMLQFVFYFIYTNLQVAFGFMASTIFSSVQTASGCSIIYILVTTLMGSFVFQNFVTDESFSRGAIFAMELIPGFALYRGIFEFASYSISGVEQSTRGMIWGDLQDPKNGLKEVLGIMAIEWFVFILLTYYLDQVVESGNGVKRSPLFFLDGIIRKKKWTLWQPSLEGRSEVNIQIQKEDIEEEKTRVEGAINGFGAPYTILCDDLKKVYPGRDGNIEKYAVRGLSLAIPTGECFGILGPNGAGKTSSINMMTGLSKPTSGSVYINGLDICEDMGTIYTRMGICPQNNLLWETLIGREHLLFYGRIKNLKGSTLQMAVETSLKSVNLFNGGIGDKLAKKYSGGMKRRLSVAISLIGNPKVVYLDEPSTGLDPASRSNLWNVLKNTKRDRAMILTTHSMEEAETLCDRLGIFVDGQFQCIGTSRELKSRYGGTYSLTISTLEGEVEEVLKLVSELSPNAKQVYAIAGTLKFELPKTEVKIKDVFIAVENAKSYLTIQAWGVADTTLEDVFIKVARETSGSDRLA